MLRLTTRKHVKPAGDRVAIQARGAIDRREGGGLVQLSERLDLGDRLPWGKQYVTLSYPGYAGALMEDTQDRLTQNR